MHADKPSYDAPIGVFDSGVGGLSVLRQLLRVLPEEDMVYFADTAWAPYGERSSQAIQTRSVAITRYLLEQHRIKAIVIACNTATTQAIEQVRAAFPDLAIIGIEPAIKPAAALTLNGNIGIMATNGTVTSQKFQQLVQQWSQGHRVQSIACNGLALAIENTLDDASYADEVDALCARYVQALGPFVSQDPEHGIDTLVLGCTHYAFALPALRKHIGIGVRTIEPGEAVARHTARLLAQKQLLRPRTHWHSLERRGHLQLLCTQNPTRLQQAAMQWLGVRNPHANLVDTNTL